MAKIAKVQEVSLSKLVLYEKNAKKHPQDQIDLLVRSIEEYGFINPCLIDKDFKVIAGHGRIEAAKQMGMDTVPCLFVEGLTEAQYKAYVLADNKLTEMGEWDMDLVLSELEDLQDMDFDISLTGFEMPEHSAKASSSMIATLPGMWIEARSEQHMNAPDPMLVTLSGMSMEVRPEQPEKARSPMLFTLSGMLTEPSFTQS